MASEMVIELLEFPDRARSCRDFHWGGNCTRKKCKLIRDGKESSLLTLIKSLDEAERTIDVVVAAITCEELADAVLCAHARGVSVGVLTNEFTTNGITPQVRSFMDAVCDSADLTIWMFECM